MRSWHSQTWLLELRKERISDAEPRVVNALNGEGGEEE